MESPNNTEISESGTTQSHGQALDNTIRTLREIEYNCTTFTQSFLPDCLVIDLLLEPWKNDGRLMLLDIIIPGTVLPFLFCERPF